MTKQIQNYIEEVFYTLAGKRAVSMVIALALLSVILVVTLTSTYVLTNAIKGNTDLGGSIRAEYAATSAIELGLSAIRGKNPGWELASRETPMTFCMAVDGSSVTSLGQVAANMPCPNTDARQKIQYWITSSAQDIGDGRYIVPPPGEGDAGAGPAGNECRRVDNYNDPDQSTDENIVKPCNWNKLYFGQSVSIPLYTTDASGNTINPPDLGGPGVPLGSFTLKVRTPCVDPVYAPDGYLKGHETSPGAEEGEWCTSSDPLVIGTGPNARPEMADTTPGPGDPTDIIVNWQILGNCDYAPNNSHDGQCIGLAVTPNVTPTDPDDNSDINIAVINDGKGSVNVPYAVLGSGTVPNNRMNVNDLKTTNLPNPPHDPILPILQYLTNPTHPGVQFPSPNLTTTRTINEPTLTLSVVSPMTAENAQGQVPYIEYQLEVDQPIADSVWTIHARGSYGNYTILKKAKKQNSASNIEFVFQN